MNNDTMKDIINDVRDLASVSDAMTRLGLDGIATRLEKLVAAGLQDSETPSSESNARPGSERRSWLELPRNITLRRYVGADRGVTLIGQYRSTDPGELGASDSRPLRVYMIRLEHHADTAWNATVMENDMIIFELQTSRGGRSMAERAAIKALKSWLNYLSHRKGKDCKKRHRKALKQRKKAARRAARMAEAASTRVAPLSPEAELAATVARQKEAV